jgi:DNA polymerase I-like protein with 3'-5' exonuclease and polymerase domains/5'-3' exonuclease
MKTKDQKTLVILDAHAIIHRAYHALPSFANSQGQPTGALYGLSAMIIRIIEELKPDYIVAAYDLPKPTFRHHAYEGYKGKRAKTDDDLVTQLISSREIFKAFGIQCLDAEGFEADDVIGTLVEQYKKTKDLLIVIASGDMDTLQLVEGKKVQVFTLKKGVTDTILYDEDAVVERFGFKPKQLVDYKGLRGDPSDNIIGVPGIGEKTATTIIQTFGSIEGLYKALEKNEETVRTAGISERMIGILKQHKDDAFFSKTLATIRGDAPITFSIPDASYRDEIDQQALLAVLSEYEFRSLVPRVKKLFHIQEEGPKEDVDEDMLHEASIALWVLNSEQANPTYDMILERTRKKTLAEAYEVILQELKKRSLLELFEKLEKPLIPIIKEMTRWGISIDQKHFEMLRERMKIQLARIESEVTKLTGASINLNSPKQLSELLFVTLGLKPKGKKKTSGAFTTNAEALEGLRDAHPVIPLLLEYREVQKLLTTYVEALLGHVKEDGRLHATFLQHGAATGRFSSVNPNLQNIPAKGEGGKEIRHGFVASKGHLFIGCDYSQIELRVLAMLSGDQQLIDTFKKGEDIHASVASAMFKVPIQEVTNDMRRKAKVINFGILYGMGVSALQKNLGSTRDEAQTYYANYFATFPSIAQYLEQTKVFARTNGYTETMFGRRRYFPAITSGAPFLRAFAERMAVNAPIQGTNADIIKIAIALIDSDLRKASLIEKAHLVLQVHDELVYEVSEDVQDEVEKIITSAMVSVFERSPLPISVPSVPLAVSIGTGCRLDELK